MVSIYVLVDPFTLKIRYIGETKKVLKDRLSNHISDAILNRDKSRRSTWVRYIIKKGKIPIIRRIATKDSKKEAIELEDYLIKKYFKKFRLINDLNAGKFNKFSARKLISKKLYMYDYFGNFVKECGLVKDIAKELNVCDSCIKRAIYLDTKSCKNYQFSREKVEKMQNLAEYSPKNHNEILLKDTVLNTEIRFTSMKKCSYELNLNFKGGGKDYLKAALNLKYGNRYLMRDNNNWSQSTYYNTAVKVVFLDDSIKLFKYQRELANFLKIKSNRGLTKDFLIKKLNKIGIKNVEFNKPICEVIHE